MSIFEAYSGQEYIKQGHLDWCWKKGNILIGAEILICNGKGPN